MSATGSQSKKNTLTRFKVQHLQSTNFLLFPDILQDRVSFVRDPSLYSVFLDSTSNCLLYIKYVRAARPWLIVLGRSSSSINLIQPGRLHLERDHYCFYIHIERVNMIDLYRLPQTRPEFMFFNIRETDSQTPRSEAKTLWPESMSHALTT